LVDSNSPISETAAVPDAIVASTPSAPTEQAMHTTARLLALALTVICVGSFLLGRPLVAETLSVNQVMGIALVGMSGSGVGALTSLLARYAAGLELDDGSRIPATAEGELYNRRIGFCMLMRPVLGLLVAPLLVAGIALFFKAHEDFKGSADAVTVVAFLGGLYAKSLLEAAKNAFKVVFRA
jgi:hypothetical protein